MDVLSRELRLALSFKDFTKPISIGLKKRTLTRFSNAVIENVKAIPILRYYAN
jgi:hypothetical protein